MLDTNMCPHTLTSERAIFTIMFLQPELEFLKTPSLAMVTLSVTSFSSWTKPVAPLANPKLPVLVNSLTPPCG